MLLLEHHVGGGRSLRGSGGGGGGGWRALGAPDDALKGAAAVPCLPEAVPDDGGKLLVVPYEQDLAYLAPGAHKAQLEGAVLDLRGLVDHPGVEPQELPLVSLLLLCLSRMVQRREHHPLGLELPGAVGVEALHGLLDVVVVAHAAAEGQELRLLLLELVEELVHCGVGVAEHEHPGVPGLREEPGDEAVDDHVGLSGPGRALDGHEAPRGRVGQRQGLELLGVEAPGRRGSRDGCCGVLEGLGGGEGVEGGVEVGLEGRRCVRGLEGCEFLEALEGRGLELHPDQRDDHEALALEEA